MSFTKTALTRVVVVAALLTSSGLAANALFSGGPAGAATPSQVCPALQGLAFVAFSVEQGWNSRPFKVGPNFQIGEDAAKWTPGNGTMPDLAWTILSGADNAETACGFSSADEGVLPPPPQQLPPLPTSTLPPTTLPKLPSPPPGPGPQGDLCIVFRHLVPALEAVEQGWDSGSGQSTFTGGNDIGAQIAAGANTNLGCQPPIDTTPAPSPVPLPTPPSGGPPSPAALCPVFQGIVSGLEAVEQGWDSGSGQSTFTGPNDIGAQIASGANSGLGCQPPIDTTPASSPVPLPSPPGGGGFSPAALCPVFAGVADGLEMLEAGWNSNVPAGAPTFAQGAEAGQFPDFAGQVASGANSGLGCNPPIVVPYPTVTAMPTLTVSAPQSGTAGTAIASSAITATLSKASSSDKATITFDVFGPSSSAPNNCSSGATAVGTATPSGDGTYHPSSGFTPTQPGNYWWYVYAPADNSDSSAASACPPTMETVVSPPTAAGSPNCPSPNGQPGYWEVATDGGLFNFGYFSYCGSMGGAHLNQPIVGLAATPDAGGYYMTAADGGIFAFGDAAFHGSMGATHLNQPVVGMAVDPATGGYWEVASDGGIFAFDAPFLGSMGATHLNQPVVGMASTPDGGGYWLVAADGGVFSFGDAVFHGSMGATTLAKPVVGIAADSATGGYWMVASDGGIFAFDAPYLGSMGGSQLKAPIVSISSPDSGGYYIAGADGGVFAFGDDAYYGSMGGHPLNQPVVGLAS